ncbi:recombinase family protein [Endozoicomonas euniceicola]|uniref:Recombinase family protein n=1 Tax=Endozoicomonas euniceicola TaxID=1234143 RepID=A0ABY6GPS7_9GAMM|nr:recombinase family protein [Endozoicomonas euniceicola]UYM14755.1 recombinase family protein [Endozoicomonas euniceicola]
MSRTFAYCRVSTAEQTTENQAIAIRKQYDVIDTRIISETISGAVVASERPEFNRLLDRLETGDTLVVLKLDRLGRDMIDVLATIDRLQDMGIKVVSMDLPCNDLTSSEGKLILRVFASVAQFEKDRIRERTIEGQARARAAGKVIGRPVATKTTDKVQALKSEGLKQTQVAKELGISLPTVKRHWNKTA